jgi:hypothetical protein
VTSKGWEQVRRNLPCVFMRTQAQRGPELNEIFSEPHHSIDIGSSGLVKPDGAPVDDPRVEADSKVKQQSAAVFATASRGQGRGEIGNTVSAEGETRAATEDHDVSAEPDITRSSTGEDFEASAGPRGRDGCAGSREPPPLSTVDGAFTLAQGPCARAFSGRS